MNHAEIPGPGSLYNYIRLKNKFVFVNKKECLETMLYKLKS